ncbi:MAG: response regulator [Myxococcota bacterium]
MDNHLPNVLVVDDEPNVRRLLDLHLSRQGYCVRAAENAAEAIELVDTLPIDIVLLDISMPQMNGFDLLALLRKRYAPATLPILMLTALDTGPDVVAALRLGANDYLTKPIDFDLLVSRMRVHLAIKLGQGQMLGGYRVVERLGAGGMGTVLAAVDIETGDPVAIKVLPRALTTSDDYVIRFLREARLAARLRHPNLVRVLGSGKEDETYFMVMERAPGRDLATCIERGPLSPLTSVRVAEQIAQALCAVHAAGIIHRDVKPENIIVDAGGVARLTDFGIAREATRSTRLTDTGRWFGSLPYASLEQLRGQEDLRSDIYALGCSLFAALTGRDPFAQDEPIERMLALKRRKPPHARAVNADVPAAVSEYVAAMMAPRASRRPQDCEEVALELARLAHELDDRRHR